MRFSKMLPWLSGIFKDSDNQPNWPRIGAVIIAVASAAWAVITFVVEHKDASGKKDGTNITVSGQGIASGGNTTINAPVNIGPNKEQIEQIQKPLVEQIAALTKMLLEKNPAAGRGAQQAVGAAVGSIAQGAAEGDARLQQALDLLKENKIAEATPLLNAVAEDKAARAGQETARAAKDRKEAAIAYRNLGAIAGLRDPKRALEAYEKAVALDPDDLKSLFWTGWLRIDYGDLNKAQTRLERVLKLAKPDDQAFYKNWALLGLGDIKHRRGDLAGALKSFNDSLAIADRLAKSDPGNTEWQRDLAVSYSRVGNVQVSQGDLAGALKSYKDSFAIADQLAKSDLGNALWQRDLSVSYEKVGNVQVAQGDLAGALKSYGDSLVIIDRLAKSDPGNSGWQRDLSVSSNEVGNVQVTQGDLAGALKSFSDSLAIRDRLAKSDPGNAGWQRDLSVSNERLGDIFLAQGNRPAALERASLERMVPIRDRDRSNADLQRFTSVTLEKIGDVQMEQGDLASALKSYQDSLGIADKLAKADPDNAGWQRDLAVSFGKLGLVNKQSGDKAKALDFFRQGQTIMARLTNLSPDNAQWKQDLAVFNQQIAELAPSRLEHGRDPRNPLSHR